MLRHYLISAWRSLRRRRLSTAVNVASLSVALAGAVLALTYVRQELTFDAFHRRADRIYRVCSSGALTSSAFMAERMRSMAVFVDPELGPELARHPSVRHAVRIRKVLYETSAHPSPDDDWLSVVFADPEILDVFDFPLRASAGGRPLADSTAILLTERAARRHFGDRDPLDLTFPLYVREYERPGSSHYVLTPRSLTVAGVLRDLPPNSSLTFDALVPYAAARALNAWGITGLYVELDGQADPQRVAAELPQYLEGDAERRLAGFSGLRLQPLRTIHFDERTVHDQLGSTPSGRPRHLYILAGMALLVLAVASLAHANLGAAQTLDRVREVGVRKVVGAVRRQLLVQFWGETVLLSLLSLGLGWALAWAASGPFGEMVSRPIAVLGSLPGDVLWGLGLALVTGLAAGAYPGLVLARTTPVSALRGTAPGSGRRSLGHATMVAQLALSAFLLVCVGVMGAQLLHLRYRRLGFDGEHVVAIGLGHGARADAVSRLRTALAGSDAVLVVAAADECPGMRYGGALWTRDDGETWLRGYSVDGHFLQAMGMSLVAGRWLDPERDRPSDAVVVNQAFVRQLGWDEPLGRRLEGLGRRLGGLDGFGLVEPTVVGVVADFHSRSVDRAIGPTLLRLAPRHAALRFAVARLAPGRVEEGVLALETAWDPDGADAPFIPRYPAERLSAEDPDTDRWTRLVSWAAGLTLTIACLSVFGLAAVEARRRRREMGIRRALGASARRLVGLQVRRFAGWVAIANLLAWPGAWLAMDRWLAGYPYHVELQAGYFIGAGAVGLVVVCLTASWHAARAALADPARVLRQE